MIDYSWYYAYLIEANHPFLVLAGEYDMKDGAAGQIAWMRKTLFTDPTNDFWTQDRKIYYYKVEGEDFSRNGGLYQSTGNFTFVTTPKSGHFIPTDNYPVSRAYLDDFVSNLQLTCDECRVNTKMCDFMANCSGHGACQDNGQCLCDAGFKGADCSY
jgi:hypothetical protein